MTIGIVSQDVAGTRRVKDLVKKAYQIAHVLGKGEPLSHELAIDGTEQLNDLIEQASIEKIFALHEAEIAVPLVAGQIRYTVGPSTVSPPPDVVAVRPTEILSAYTRRDGLDLPMFVTHAKADYDSICLKTLGSAGGRSHVLYYQAAYPLGAVYVYPQPADTGTTLFLTGLAALAPFTYLEQEVDLPPGYYQYLKYALARRLCADIGLPFGDDNAEILLRCTEALVSNNIKPMPVSVTGLSGLASSTHGYNILGDTVAR